MPEEPGKNGKLLSIIEPHFTIGNLISVATIVITVGISWGALNARLNYLTEHISEHIGDTQRHQPILEKQKMMHDQIDMEMGPIKERIKAIEETLDRVEQNQVEVLRILGARPPRTR